MRILRTASLFLALVLAAGCDGDPPPPPPPPGDGGGLDGAIPNPGLDSDGDGLCDGTERIRNTDPFSPDTDLDGITDRVELDFGYNPLQPSSPDRAQVFFLTENPVSTRQVPITRVIRGDGENYTGAFESLPVLDELDQSAINFYEDSLAVGAIPMANVVMVAPEEERFYGVVGQTELVFEVRLSFGGNVPRLCTRAYPFRYQIKRSDGRILYIGRFLMVVLPDGERIDTAEWCEPFGGCI